MLVKRKKPRDDIPTLTDLVEDHSPDLERSETEFAAEHSVAVPSSAGPSVPHGRVRSAFEVAVEAMVAEILNRHMARAREEITRSVLAEVRSRLHGGSRGKAAK